jgi:cytochrome c556
LNIKQKKEKQMCKSHYAVTLILLACCASTSRADEDSRQFIELPKMMQDHMMSNMRDHLASINEILQKMKNGELDKAAEVAESRLGMSSLELHGASHMAKFMPEGMREAGTNMHKAASRFALKAQEGEALPAYNMLAEVTAACVTCHAAYRIR